MSGSKVTSNSSKTGRYVISFILLVLFTILISNMNDRLKGGAILKASLNSPSVDKFVTEGNMFTGISVIETAFGEGVAFKKQ